MVLENPSLEIKATHSQVWWQDGSIEQHGNRVRATQ